MTRHSSLARRALVVALALVLAPATSLAQEPPPFPWLFRTRLVLSGNSDESEPAGFSTYSTIAIEAGLARRLGPAFDLELSLRTESREVDYEPAAGPRERLGSLELVPLNLFLLWHAPGTGKVKPYLGAGLNVTVTWEKSGVLDSLDVKPSIGPAVYAGATLRLTDYIGLEAAIRWNSQTTDIEGDGIPYASLKVHPLALSFGLGFRF